jgi:hypothetical protein
MPLEDFIITVFCWVEEHLEALIGDHRLRQRGFAPKLTDSEVITMEVVGEFLGWIPMWASGSTSVDIGRRGFRNSDRAPRLPSRRPISGSSSSGCISNS